jgi:hypothetical protein
MGEFLLSYVKKAAARELLMLQLTVLFPDCAGCVFSDEPMKGVTSDSLWMSLWEVPP